jgi:hypothetical protein
MTYRYRASPHQLHDRARHHPTPRKAAQDQTMLRMPVADAKALGDSEMANYQLFVERLTGAHTPQRR